MLQISNLSFSYPGKELFRQTNLNIAYPQVLAIIGDNGTGKTTLLRLINGELSPDDGTIRTFGTIGYLPQTHESITDKSGGERTRLALEQLFAQNYDLLLLDEPTNNLDLHARAWLLQKLQHYNGLVLIVSHDRAFIDQIATGIIELKSSQLILHSGNYSDYIARQVQAEREQLQTYQKAQRAKQQLEKRISRAYNNNNRVSSLHFNKIRDENKMAFHGRRNHAQNTASRIINTAQTQLARLSQIEKPLTHKTYQAKISADFLRRRRLLQVSELSKSYDTKQLFSNLSFELYTGERLQILGENGAGKTTLFKIILNTLADHRNPRYIPDHGEVKLAPHLKLGYISQDISGLDLNRSFLQQSDHNPTEIFQAASTMDLVKTDLESPVGQLSRGQITKLAFLKIILAPVDLLILDEPTNHLDIRARENIEQALTAYPGTIIFATHDTAFAAKFQADQLTLSDVI